MEPPLKKMCPEINSTEGLEKSSHKNNANIVPQPVDVNFADLSNMEIVKVLSTNDTNCSVVVEAKHNSKEGRVLLQMQKTPFAADQMEEIVSGSTRLAQLFRNDIYNKYTATLPAHLNKLQATLIHPATPAHFARFERAACSLVQETPHLYQTVSRPWIEAGGSHTIDWIVNILEGRSEVDRVVLRDDSPTEGFVLLPDLKWTGEQINDLYCQALVMRRDLKCVRDLNESHIPLLKNIKEKGLKGLKERYGIEPDRVRTYFHYLPSFYHLHVHFSALSFDAPGTFCGKAHLLSDVISNLSIDGAYYSKATLSFTVRDNHPHPLAHFNRNPDAKSSHSTNDSVPNPDSMSLDKRDSVSSTSSESHSVTSVVESGIEDSKTSNTVDKRLSESNGVSQSSNGDQTSSNE